MFGVFLLIADCLGTFNKVFLLTFDDGLEAIARIPTPTLGPRIVSKAIASEVATMDFCRSKLDLKITIPRVLAWSRSPEDRAAVGTDYIIMEKVPGVPLFKRTIDLTEVDLDAPLIEDLVEFERPFNALSFSQIGSIYYKEDVSPELQSRRLYAHGVEDDEFSERFRIGPVLDRQFWSGGRDALFADRGPCTQNLLSIPCAGWLMVIA